MRVLIIAGSIVLIGIALYAKEDVRISDHPAAIPSIKNIVPQDTIPKKRMDDSLNKYRRDTFHRDTFGLKQDSLIF